MDTIHTWCRQPGWSRVCLVMLIMMLLATVGTVDTLVINGEKDSAQEEQEGMVSTEWGNCVNV